MANTKSGEIILLQLDVSNDILQQQLVQFYAKADIGESSEDVTSVADVKFEFGHSFCLLSSLGHIS